MLWTQFLVQKIKLFIQGNGVRGGWSWGALKQWWRKKSFWWKLWCWNNYARDPAINNCIKQWSQPMMPSILFYFLCFEVSLGSIQNLLLTLCSGIIHGRTQWTTGIKARLVMYKVSILSAILSLNSPNIFF